MSLRWRWALTLGGVTALVSMFVLIASGVLTARELRSSIDDDLTQRVDLLADGGIPTAPRAPFEGIRRRRNVVNLDALYRVIDPAGRVVVEASDPDLPISDAAMRLATTPGGGRLFETVETDEDRYRVLTAALPRVGPGPDPGTAQVAISLTPTDANISALVRRSTVLGLILIGSAAAIGWYMAGRTVAPLAELTAETERIARNQDLETTVSSDRSDEVGRLASSFAAMIHSLRSSRNQQQRLVADAGHEFRTPLTALRTNLETLQRKRQDLSDEQITTLLDAAVAESIELTDLSSELVELSQDVTASGETLQTVDLRDIADQVVAKFRSRTTDPIDLIGAGALVDIRQSQIDRAITNLLSNASTWNRPGGVITVEVDGPTIRVRDSGPGFDPQDIDHVFERFYRSDRARANPGSGLGLSIVTHIVEGHGGSVFARNHPDGGAEVGFSLRISQ